MTVGIGLLCDNGKKIILCADTRASYGDSTQHDETGKLFELPFDFCGAIAGSLGWCQEIVSEVYHRMAQMNESDVCAESIRRAIIDSYDQIYLPLFDEALRHHFKITLDEYKHDTKLSLKLRKLAIQVLRTLEVDVDLIIAGFVKGGPVQFVATGGTGVSVRPEITPGNAVIGSGASAALNWLNYRKQNVSFGLAHSLLHITEAKQFAQVESTVGPLRHMVLLWSGGYKPLEGGQDFLTELWRRFGLLLSDGLELEKFNEEARKVFGLPQ